MWLRSSRLLSAGWKRFSVTWITLCTDGVSAVSSVIVSDDIVGDILHRGLHCHVPRASFWPEAERVPRANVTRLVACSSTTCSALLLSSSFFHTTTIINLSSLNNSIIKAPFHFRHYSLHSKRLYRLGTSRRPSLPQLLPSSLHTYHRTSLFERFGNSRLSQSLLCGMPCASSLLALT